MEQSFVKLRIAEKEERIQKEKERRNSKPSAHNKMSIQQKDGKYFLVRLDMQIQRIHGMINAAEQDSRLSQLPDEASGKIRTAIGKGQLLLSKRFKQFKELCYDNIENDPDKKETKSSDLQGYWDMMFIQVEDVNSLFNEIQKLKENNWESVEIETTDGSLKPNGSAAPKNRRSPNSKSPRSKNKNNNVDDEKVKREARSRLAAARKQAKLRIQQEAEAANASDGTWTVETTNDTTNVNEEEKLNDSTVNVEEELNSSINDGEQLNSTSTNGADISLNSSINTEYSLTSSNSSSAELLSNGTSTVESIPPVAIEVNGVA